jgi:hypothetical protein
LRLVEVSLDSPRAQIIRDEDGELVPIRIAPAAPEEEEVAVEDPSEPGPPLPIAIDTLRLSGIELLLLNLTRERPPIVLEMEGLALEDFRLERGTMTLGSLDLASPSVTVLRDANFATQFQRKSRARRPRCASLTSSWTRRSSASWWGKRPWWPRWG